MKTTTSWKTILSCCLAATLAMAALGCAEEEGGNNEGPASTAGTNCPEIVCDATGSVKTGTPSTSDEYAANAGCVFTDVGTCADGCDTSRTISKLPGCDVGSACNVIARDLPAPGDVTSDTQCASSMNDPETLSNTEVCGGYPCLSRNASGIATPPFFCAVQSCDSDEDCPADHFCRCIQEEVAAGAFTAERWCVRRAQ